MWCQAEAKVSFGGDKMERRGQWGRTAHLSGHTVEQTVSADEDGSGRAGDENFGRER